MSGFSITISPRFRKLLRVAAWGALIVVILGMLPSVALVLSHLTDWFTGLYLHPSRLWKESPWSY